MESSTIENDVKLPPAAIMEYFADVPLGLLLNIAGRQMQEILNAATAGSGLSTDHMTVLGAVERLPGKGQNVYARMLGLNDATFGRYVARLEEDSLLWRRRSKSDRRLIALYPTERGTEMVGATRGGLMSCNAHMMDLLPDGQGDRLTEMLREFVISYMFNPPEKPVFQP